MKTSNTFNGDKGINETNYSGNNLNILSINDLSKEEKQNYETKKEIINLTGFVDMRILQKEELLIEELTFKGYSRERIQEILKSLKGISEEKNEIINKLLMETILLPKIENTYIELKSKLENTEINKILDECHENAKNYIKNHLKWSSFKDFNLRKQSKVARGETFLFLTNENKDKYIILEVQKKTKDMDIKILDDQDFIIRIHFDEDTDITKMSDILLQGKKLLDNCFKENKIRYVIVSSWLFDDEFNEFWMKERIKEGKKEIPNRIKVREESLNYGGKLNSEEPSIEDPIDENFIQGEENSMTRAVKKYLSEGHILKEGGGYVDLELLEKWKIKQQTGE